MSNVIWIIAIGFVAGIIAKFISPRPNEPSGFVITTLLGIGGAFVATVIGQTIGWYRLDQGAGLLGATLGALLTNWQANKERAMGWREILNGMLNGPRGQRQPTKDTGGGMSPVMMALLGYLAYKAFKGSTGGQSPSTPARFPSDRANDRASNGELIDKLGGLLRSGKLSQSAENATVSGSIADMVRTGLRTVLGGAGAGAVLSGGLGTLIKEFQQRGQGQAAQTWVSTGPNRAIAPNELADALGNDTLDEISKQTGMRREEVIVELSKHLPQLIDQLTPNGRVPTIEEASRMVA